MKAVARLTMLSIIPLVGAGCAPAAGTVLNDLYKAPLPARVKVVHYRADTMGMDPSFAWELAPIDEAYLKKLITGGGLKAPPAGERPSSANYRWPAWWNTQRVEALPECYFDDSGGLRRVWVDRKNNRLFVEFVGT